MLCGCSIALRCCFFKPNIIGIIKHIPGREGGKEGMKEGNLYVVMLQWVVDGCWRRGGSSSECCRYNAQEN